LAFAPTSIDANLALVNLYLETDRQLDAEAPLRTLARSGHADHRLALADYYASQNKPGEALAVLTGLMKEEGASVAARSRMAGLDYEAGRREQAHAALDTLLQNDPTNAAVIVVKGGWLLTEGKLEEALTRAQEAVKADATLTTAHALLGSVRAARGDAEGAVEAYRELLRLDQRSLTAQLELARLYLKMGRIEQARPYAQEAVSSQPSNGAGHLLLGTAQLAMGNLTDAESEARLLVEGAPTRPEGHALMGEVLLRRGNREGARRAFDAALQRDAGSLNALAGLLRLDARDELASATQRIDARLAATPDDPQLLFLSAKAHASAGDHAAAEATMRRIIALAPAYTEAYAALGDLYIRQGKLSVALAEFDGLTARQPKNVSAHTVVAMLLQVQGRTDEARVRYERILEIDRRAVVAANNLAFMHAEKGTNLDQALSLAQAAKAQAPEDADVDDTLGWVYVKHRLASLAIEPLERSVKKDPTNAQFHYHLGVAYLQTGNRARAREAFDRALTLGLSSSEAAEATKALASAVEG
jgi:Flp pilus assembly protein TadD